MDKTYPPEAWKRLGRLLEARRGELGYGFRQREKFLACRGGPPPSVKTLARLERGERTAYPPATVTRLESLYGWAPGSFQKVLEGGEPEEAAAPRLSAVPRPELPPGADGVPRRVLDLLQDSPQDDWPMLMDIWSLPAWHFSEEERLRMMTEWQHRDDPPQGERRPQGS